VGAVDFVITFFASRPLLSRLLASRLVNPVYEYQCVVDGPTGTTKYDAYVQKQGGLAGIIKQAAYSAKQKGLMRPGDRVGRVALMGFSEGNAGVRACLRGNVATAVDAVFSIDGMHSMFNPNGSISLEMLMPWIGFARLAVRDVPNDAQSNGKLFCCTHSMISPTGYAPVRECAPIVWDQALDAEKPREMESDLCAAGPRENVACTDRALDYLMDAVRFPNDDLPIGVRGFKENRTQITQDGFVTVRPKAAETNFADEMPFVFPSLNDGLVIRRHANGLHIYGWAYETPSNQKDSTGNRDHIFQAEIVGPYMVASALGMRWNVQTAMSGLGAFGGAFGGGDEFDRQPQDFLPGMGPDAGAAGSVPPIDCPVPPPGWYTVGNQFDPCWQERAVPPGMGERVPSEADDRLLNAALLVGGAAAGWAVARRFRWRVGR